MMAAMRGALGSFVAITLVGCTTVRTVTVTPAQLQALAGMGPNEERNFTPQGETESKVARGDDQLRLQVSPERTKVAAQPWAKLYTLHWGPVVSVTPTAPAGKPDLSAEYVPATEITGADLQMRRVDTWKTIGVTVGVTLGVALSLAFIAAIVVVFLAGSEGSG